ncbi:MAG: hypothetical protein JWO31_615, partial [Phycisphaerales bacterium]|nr:hypothetical protein [Phycisphaerales bacterium]
DVPAAASTRRPHPPPAAGGVLRLTIKELGNFEYNPAADDGKAPPGDVPADVARLDGATVLLRGYMVATEQADRPRRFALVPSLFDCCYGRPPAVQHRVAVECAPGFEADLTAKPVVVRGTLRVREERQDGYVVSLFTVVAAQVSPSGR